jgi:hypothetical protein
MFSYVCSMSGQVLKLLGVISFLWAIVTIVPF